MKQQVDEWESSAGNILAHYRAVLRGFLPFELAKTNLNELIAREKLDASAACYVEHAVRLIAPNGRDLIFSFGLRKWIAYTILSSNQL